MAGLRLHRIHDLEDQAELARVELRAHMDSCACHRTSRRCGNGLAALRKFSIAVDRLNATRALKAGVSRHPRPAPTKYPPPPPPEPYTMLDTIQALREEKAKWRWYWFWKRRREKQAQESGRRAARD